MSDFAAGVLIGAVLGGFGVAFFVAIVCCIAEAKESQ